MSFLSHRHPTPCGVWRILSMFLLGLVFVGISTPATARDGRIYARKTALKETYRFKKGVRYLPVKATLSALGIQHQASAKEQTVHLESSWNGTVYLLFGKNEAQFGGQIIKLEPTPIERDGDWYLPVPLMERLLGITATVDKQADLHLAGLAQVIETPAGLQLKTGIPVTPKGFYLDNPPRYVLDLPGIVLDKKYDAPFTSTEEGYKSMRLGQFEQGTARVVYDLNRAGYRPPAAGSGASSLLSLGTAATKSQYLSQAIKIGMAPTGAGLVIDGLYAAGAEITSNFKNDLIITFTSAQLQAQPRDYLWTTGMPDLGFRKIHLQNASDSTVRMYLQLANAAPQASVSIDLVNSRTILQLQPDHPVLPNQPSTPPTPRGTGLAGKTIVIDPGHGGPWPGATMEVGMMGKVRLKESDLNLRMSLDLAERLRQKGANVVLTRADDVAVKGHTDRKKDLYARLEIATENKANLMVSIHCNSFRKIPSDALSGTEVYFYKNADKAVANTFYQHMAAQTKRGGRGALYSPFVVCKHPTIPSVLVETGYLSNPEEYALFSNSNHTYEKTLMTGLLSGIEAFFSGNTSAPTPTIMEPEIFTERVPRPHWLDEPLREMWLLEGPEGTTPVSPITSTPPVPVPEPGPTTVSDTAPRTELPYRSSRFDIFRPGSGAPMTTPETTIMAPSERDPEITFGLSAPTPPASDITPLLGGMPEETTTPAPAEVPGHSPEQRRFSIFSLG